MEQPYNNRELDMKFQSLETLIDVNHTETMDKLGEMERRNHDKQVTMSDTLGQLNVLVTATNGKVRKLEKWQAGLVMAGSVSLFLGGIIIAMGLYIYNGQVATINNLKTNQKELRTTVQTLQDNQK